MPLLSIAIHINFEGAPNTPCLCDFFYVLVVYNHSYSFNFLKCILNIVGIRHALLNVTYSSLLAMLHELCQIEHSLCYLRNVL